MLGAVTSSSRTLRTSSRVVVPDVAGVRPIEGSSERNLPVAYEITATVREGGREFNIPAMIEQDEKSVIRQEYADQRSYGGYSKLAVPSRAQLVRPETENFRPEEFLGSYEFCIDDGMSAMAQKARDAYGAAVRLSSAFRNPRRNKGISKIKPPNVSRHVLGRAVDMVPMTNTPENRFLLYQASVESGNGSKTLLEFGGRQLLAGDHEIDAAELGKAGSLSMNVTLKDRVITDSGEISFRLRNRQTMAIAGATTFSQTVDGQEVACEVKSVESGSSKKGDLVVFDEGCGLTAAAARLVTPYGSIFRKATHVHMQR